MTLDDYDPRTVAACTIEWYEDETSGRNYLLATCDDGGRHEVEWAGDPIDPAMDLNDVAEYVAAELSLEVLSVHHDGEVIRAIMRQL